MESVLYEILITQGWQVLTLAALTILLVGVLKIFGAFKWVSDAKKKTAYQVATIIIALGLTLVVDLIFNNFCGTGLAVSLGAVVIAANALYPLYENLGLRAFIREVGNFLILKIAKEKVAEKVNEIVGNISDTKLKAETKEEVKEEILTIVDAGPNKE